MEKSLTCFVRPEKVFTIILLYVPVKCLIFDHDNAVKGALV